MKMRAPRTEIFIALPGIKTMVWGNAKRDRREAERLIRLMEREISGWRKYTLTWSRVSSTITWERKGKNGHLLNEQGASWYSNVRADDFWEAVGMIIVWYSKQSERYRNIKSEV